MSFAVVDANYVPRRLLAGPAAAPALFRCRASTGSSRAILLMSANFPIHCSPPRRPRRATRIADIVAYMQPHRVLRHATGMITFAAMDTPPDMARAVMTLDFAPLGRCFDARLHDAS